MERPTPVATTLPESSLADKAVRVEPRSIRYDAEDKMVFVEAKLVGESLATRKDPLYVGVTVVTPEGHEIDLMVQTLFPGSFGQPVLFTAGVEEPVQDVLIGAWDKRIEPCQVDRYGCRKFGFVLDGSLGSWPKGLYNGAPRERILPLPLRVQIVGPAAEAARVALIAVAQPSVALFGSKLDIQLEPDTGTSAKQVVVRYAHPHDQALAERIAAAVAKAVGAPSGTAEPIASPGDIALLVELK